MKYTDAFNRDFKWFLKVRHLFNFDGSEDYYNKVGEPCIVYNKNGVDGKRAFYMYDTHGKIFPTKHPNLLHTLFKVKGSVNLHIKMYAEDRAACNWGKIECRALCIKLKAPDWFRNAIEEQKWKYVN